MDFAYRRQLLEQLRDAESNKYLGIDPVMLLSNWQDGRIKLDFDWKNS